MNRAGDSPGKFGAGVRGQVRQLLSEEGPLYVILYVSLYISLYVSLQVPLHAPLHVTLHVPLYVKDPNQTETKALSTQPETLNSKNPKVEP